MAQRGDMIERTQRKLREAQFFLRQLTTERYRFAPSDPEAFLHYLSAFLSAARSITFVMQNEAKEQYDAWFPSWLKNCTEGERDLLQHMNAQRVAEIHRDGADTTVEWEVVPMVEQLARDLDRHPAYHFHYFRQQAWQRDVKRPTHYFELGSDKADVITRCQHYLGVLEKLVREFMQAHER
jgi:hypothetical protein